MKYVVKIIEEWEDCFIVEADTKEEAENILMREFCKDNVDVMNNGYYSNDFCALKEADEDDFRIYREVKEEDEEE